MVWWSWERQSVRADGGAARLRSDREGREKAAFLGGCFPPAGPVHSAAPQPETRPIK